MPPTRKRAAKKAPPVEFVEATAVEVKPAPYTEDDNWDGVPEIEEIMPAEPTVEDVTTEDAPKKRGRQVSPFALASRNFDAAHKAAEKARAAYEKVRKLADAKDAAEAEEAVAYEALQVELAKLNG